jgi:ABC-2 type transport system ATP-binding protein/lipopolysaccharide transport system ATP-binding protein
LTVAAIETEDLCKDFLVGFWRPRPYRALDRVSIAVEAGDVFGFLGPNGAGKSTTLKLAAGIYRPDAGHVRRGGRVAAMIELSAGFHPDLSGRENVYLSGALLGLRRKEVHALLPAILDFAGIGAFVEAPLRVYSTGMVVRLGFAVASYVPAEILLVDEVLAVGDIDFHAKCVDRMAERRRANVSLLLVSHQLAVVEQFCDRAIFIDRGRKALEGRPVEVLDEYRRRMAAPEAGPDRSRDPEVRSGSGDVRIVGIEVTGRGPDAPRVTAGAPFAVRLTLETVRQGPSPSLGVEIHGLDGVLVARSESPGDGSVTVPPGPGTAEVVFRRNALLPGAYVLSVSARDPAGHADLDVQVKAHRFAVHGDRTGGERGVVSLDGAWTR